jgi:UMP-CMP kinase
MQTSSQDDRLPPQPTAPKKDAPALSPSKVAVIFVLGGPGAGKGTQCEKLVRDYEFIHLSAGDLLRAEQDREGSEFGEMIKQHIKDGIIVPMEVTVRLLENAMKEHLKGGNGEGRFLIDGGLQLSVVSSHQLTHLPLTGFPRKMDQALGFEESVCPSRFTFFFDCPEEVMLERLLKRGKTSGRADDNVESIKKRFKTFEETSMPVVWHFEKQGKVIKIDAIRGPDEVYAEVRKQMALKEFEEVKRG